MRKLLAIVALLSVCAWAPAYAQTGNTLHVHEFMRDRNMTVGEGVAAAAKQCIAALPCILVIDPTLASWPPGVMPALPANVHIEDWREGLPWAGSSGGGGTTAPAAPVGVFADNGAVDADVLFLQFAGVVKLYNFSVAGNDPWIGCTSPGHVWAIDEFGQTVATMTLLANGSLPGPYLGDEILLNTFYLGGGTTLRIQYSSPGGCSSFPTQVQIDLPIQQILVLVFPGNPTVAANGLLQLTASVTFSPVCVPSAPGCGMSSTAVLWSVDGIAGGNSSVGTVTPGGMYTAPSSPGTHTITATSVESSAAAGSAIVTVT